MGPRRIEYEIGGKNYYQRPLVIGQAIQLLEALGEAGDLPATDDALEWLRALGEHAAEALAVVLVAEDAPLAGRDLAAHAEELRWAVDVPTALRVIRDFFALAPAAECAPLIEEIKERLGSLWRPASGPSSPTSPAATPSAGGK